ncbi:hypothetical protein FIBSPDRAFT_447659 [Athelia psychrophila]|uniref:DUF6533 domain-containing protein n=1 Tax=Athelia psychrophila TaxID=1759441 RepID=A0A166MC80_9AGAM|nr:hypothetical protein FIBSPDRAFT_447659 [Fibularhizoctonia sp. CBS 109695]
MDDLSLAGPDMLGEQLKQYLAFACLTLSVWDWLLALSDEYDIIRRTLSRRVFNWRSAGVISAYIVCRASSAGYAIVTVILAVAKFDSCRGIGRIICILYGISAPATALLFCFRVSAIYLNSRIMVAFFTLGWLAVTGCRAYDAYLGMLKFSSGPDRSCGIILPANGKIDAVSYVSLAVYDTVVYLAISWRLSSEPMTGSHWQARLSSFVSGTGLYRLSRTLLRDGQFYYL